MPTDQAESADAKAFVRLAVDSIHRLVTDDRLAAELAEEAVAETDDPMERLLAAQRVLARVLAYERATLGPALSVAEVKEWIRQRSLDVEDAMRLLYELSLGGGRSWPAVLLAKADLAEAQRDERSPEDDARVEGVTDPWLRALQLLVSPEGATSATRKVRHAVATGRSVPLGYAGLVLELADEAPVSETDGASPLVQVAERLDDALLRREAPERSFDLRARCATYLADVARRQGQIEDGQRQLGTAVQLLERGTGDPVVASLIDEAWAGLALARGDRDEALHRFSAAAARFDDAPNAPNAQNDEVRHRRVEIELKRALVLAGDASSRLDASAALADLAESLVSEPEREGDIDAELGLRVVLARARVELDLARQAVAETAPLEDVAPEDALASYAEAWSDQSVRLERAAKWLHDAEFWLDVASERARAEHQWLGGLALLLTDRRRAAEALRSSVARFQRLGEETTVRQISIDLIVCGVLAGALGDTEFGDGSEPLELFRQLTAART